MADAKISALTEDTEPTGEDLLVTVNDPGGTPTTEAAQISNVLINANLNTTAGDLGGAWAAWTPSYANLTIGNGTVTSDYTTIGKTIHFRWIFTLGSTSAVGTAPTITVPVAAHAEYVGSSAPVHTVQYVDTGTANYAGFIRFNSATVVSLRAMAAGGTYVTTHGSSLSATVPHTWANTDVISVCGTYEAA